MALAPPSDLRAIKLIHTVAWAFFPLAAWHQRFGLALVCAVIVAGEVLVLALNGMKCPLTPLAARYTDDRRDNFDIHLPLLMARYNKEILGTLDVAGLVFGLCSGRTHSPDWSEGPGLPLTWLGAGMATITVHTGDAPDLESFLSQRIYEYNAAATGYHDGESFSAVHQDESGSIEAGIYGFTWGGCCFISYLWVAEALRRGGMGSELLRAVEGHAREKRCRLVLLSSHSFQAPGFYARMGYEQIARIDDYPVGHADIFYAKRMDT